MPAVREGLGLGRRDARVSVEVVDDRRPYARVCESLIGIQNRAKKGGCLPIPGFPARLVEGELILDGALGSVEGCSHLGDRDPAKRKRDVLLAKSWGLGMAQGETCDRRWSGACRRDGLAR